MITNATFKSTYAPTICKDHTPFGVEVKCKSVIQNCESKVQGLVGWVQ